MKTDRERRKDFLADVVLAVLCVVYVAAVIFVVCLAS